MAVQGDVRGAYQAEPFSSVARKPARVMLTNIATGDEYAMQFNPTQLTEKLAVVYARRKVPGLSHQPLQFVHTGNNKIKLTFFFVSTTRAELLQNIDSRRFLKSVCLPRDLQGGPVATAGAPRILLVWPKFLVLTCVVTALNFTHVRFSPDGWPLESTAEVSLEEIRDVRWLSSDALYEGTGEVIPPGPRTY